MGRHRYVERCEGLLLKKGAFVATPETAMLDIVAQPSQYPRTTASVVPGDLRGALSYAVYRAVGRSSLFLLSGVVDGNDDNLGGCCDVALQYF